LRSFDFTMKKINRQSTAWGILEKVFLEFCRGKVVMSPLSKVIMSPFEPRKVRDYDNGADDDFKGSRPLGNRKTNRK